MATRFTPAEAESQVPRVSGLCRRLGEPSIPYWHGVNEGFASRKTIDREFRDHHRGGPDH